MLVLRDWRNSNSLRNLERRALLSFSVLLCLLKNEVTCVFAPVLYRPAVLPMAAALGIQKKNEAITLLRPWARNSYRNDSREMYHFLITIHFQRVCVCVWVWDVLSHAQLFATPWTIAGQTPLSMEESVYWGRNTGVGCHFLLHAIFLTQGWNLHR